MAKIAKMAKQPNVFLPAAAGQGMGSKHLGIEN